MFLIIPRSDLINKSQIADARYFSGSRRTAPDPAAAVRADPDTSWRLLYNALPPEAALKKVAAEGEATLAAPLLSTRSVMV